MGLSIYDQESAQEGSANKDTVIDVTSSMLTMTASFVFCAVFIAVMLNGSYVGWLYTFLSALKSVLLVGVMIFLASLIAHVFTTAMVRRINSMVLGMVMAFALIFFNIL